MEDAEFERIIDQAVSELPQEFRDKMENVAIVMADFPTNQQLSKLAERNERGLLLGLYEGIPKTKRRYYGVGGQLPDKITIFKYPLLQISSSLEDAIQNIKDTVIHEIAHHFGLSDDDIRKAKLF